VADPPRGKAPAAEVTVYITNTGKKYHRAGCSYLRQSQKAISLDEAIRLGYTPCSRCGP
jgi:micrococcal nuclease